MHLPHRCLESGSKFGIGSPQEGHTGGGIFKAPALFLQSVQTLRSLQCSTGAEQTIHVSGKNRFSRLSKILEMLAIS